jgi:hypothetical protein
MLHPTGEFDPKTSELLMEVRSFNNQSNSYMLRWLEDNENVLYAVATSGDETNISPELEGKVSVTLAVQEVKEINYGAGAGLTTWLALLVPVGKKVNGFIISNVEIVK